MEFLNRIELAGIVGSIRKQTAAGKVVTNFSVLIEHHYKDRNENAVIESSWFNVIAWQNDKMPDLEKIGRGSRVHIQGRLRTKRYVSENGEPRTLYEVIASEVKLQS